MPRQLESDHRAYGITGDLFPRDIRYDPADAAYCARIDAARLFFRIVAEDSFSEVLLVTRFDGEVTAHELNRFSGTGRFAVWELEMADPGAPFEYSFAMRTGEGSACYLAPSGITNAIERLDRWYLDPAEIASHQTPGWAVGATIYQIFPDRFAMGDLAAQVRAVEPWGSSPHPLEFQGGNLAGIVDKAPYLSDLGIEAVYLNPIFSSPSNHRYDAIDYYQVDPGLGGNDAFAEMVTELHKRDIKVILDTSLNHCHPRFFAFADIMEKGPRSEYTGWFDVFDYPARVKYRPHAVAEGPAGDWARRRAATLAAETGLDVEEVDDDGPLFEPTFDAWYGVPTMPRVNLQHPGARQYMLDVAAHWVEDYDIDGWRMDVARYVDSDFWDDFRDAVKAVKPDCYLVSEVMGDSSLWLQGNRFDATMNYTFRDLCLELFAKQTVDVPTFLDGYTRMYAMYSPPVGRVNFNLLSSHDTPRFLTEAGGDEWRLLLATLFQLTVPGAACIYYGDELAMLGGEEPASRAAFPQELPPDKAAIHSEFRDLIRLRRDSAILRTGTWELAHVEELAFAYRRVSASGTVAVAINVSDRPVSIPIGMSRRCQPLWGHGTARIEGDEAWIRDLPPRSGAVVQL